MYTIDQYVATKGHNVSTLTEISEAATKAASSVKPMEVVIDSNDNALLPDLVLSPEAPTKIPVPAVVVGEPMATTKDSYFPITIITGPGTNQPTAPDPEAEKKRRQQLIAFGSIFLVLLVMLIVLLAKKQG